MTADLACTRDIIRRFVVAIALGVEKRDPSAYDPPPSCNNSRRRAGAADAELLPSRAQSQRDRNRTQARRSGRGADGMLNSPGAAKKLQKNHTRKTNRLYPQTWTRARLYVDDDLPNVTWAHSTSPEDAPCRQNILWASADAIWRGSFLFELLQF